MSRQLTYPTSGHYRPASFKPDRTWMVAAALAVIVPALILFGALYLVAHPHQPAQPDISQFLATPSPAVSIR